MVYIITDRDELIGRATDAFDRFAAVAAEVHPQTRARGSDWTAQQVVAHVLSVMHRYTDRDLNSWDGLSATPSEVNEQNAKEAALYENLTMAELLPATTKDNLNIAQHTHTPNHLHTMRRQSRQNTLRQPTVTPAVHLANASPPARHPHPP